MHIDVLQEESIHQIIDPELEAIKARVKEMEEEAEKLKQMQSEVNKQMTLGSPTGTTTIPLSIEEKKEIDDRSIYVGNVDYGATAEELEAHFHGCGSMNRVTILCNKSDGHPKGFAYIEFGSKEFVETALGMNESLFRGRQIKVRVNIILHIPVMRHHITKLSIINGCFLVHTTSGHVKENQSSRHFDDKQIPAWFSRTWSRNGSWCWLLSWFVPWHPETNVS